MHRDLVSKFLLFLQLLIIAGCSPSIDPETDRSTQASTQPLNDFPLTSRLMLGEFQAQIKPLISLPVSASTAGDIIFQITRPRLMLEQGTKWAEVGAEQIASEERELELSTRSEKLALQDEIQKAERELAVVEYMLADPALRGLPLKDRIPVSTNLVEQLRNEMVLLKRQLDACGEADRLALKQKNLRSRLVMPFDGELLVYLPVSKVRREFRVPANTPIGIMRDVSELYLNIIVRDPHIIGIPTSQLAVELKRENGQVFTGRFHDTQIAELQQQDVLVYRFSFEPECNEELRVLIGANLTCSLWVESGQAFHCIPKIEVARMLPEKSTLPGWREGIKELWPSAELAYAGRSHLGIIQEEAGDE